MGQLTAARLRFCDAAMCLAISGCVRIGYDTLDNNPQGVSTGGASGAGGSATGSSSIGGYAPSGGVSNATGGSSVRGSGGLASGGASAGNAGASGGSSAIAAGGSSAAGAGGTTALATGGSSIASLGGTMALATGGRSAVAIGGGGASAAGGSSAAGAGGTTALATGGRSAVAVGGGGASAAGGSSAVGSGGTTALATGGRSAVAVGGGGALGTGGSSAGAVGGGGTSAVGGNGGSGGTSGTAGTAGTTTRTTCDWSSGPPQFGTAQSLGAPNTAASEIDPVLSHDGLTLYFVSYRDSTKGNDIYYATRADVTASFGAGSLLSAASSTSNDTHLFVSVNGLEAFLASDRSGTIGGADIFRATRSTTTDVWGTFTSVPNINSTGGEFDPHLESNGLTLWFDPVGRAEGLGQQDLFYAVRNDLSSPFGTPIAANDLNSTGNDWNVSLTDDSRVIVFQSDRSSPQHVYFAFRSSPSTAFTAPSIITALDSYMTTLSDPFVAPDGCAIYFASQLSGGAGLADLYVVKATP